MIEISVTNNGQLLSNAQSSTGDTLPTQNTVISFCVSFLHNVDVMCIA